MQVRPSNTGCREKLQNACRGKELKGLVCKKCVDRATKEEFFVLGGPSKEEFVAPGTCNTQQLREFCFSDSAKVAQEQKPPPLAGDHAVTAAHEEVEIADVSGGDVSAPSAGDHADYKEESSDSCKLELGQYCGLDVVDAHDTRACVKCVEQVRRCL
jgi:hypothetical protein